MRKHHLNHFLRSAALELGEGGGSAAPAAVVDAPAAAAPEAPAPTPAPAAATPSPREPSMLEKVQGAIRDKGVIIAENNTLKEELLAQRGLVTERDGTIAALTAQISALQAENGQLKTDLAGIDAALKSTEQKVITIDAAAARDVAKMGFEAATLPAAEKQGESIEAMETRLGQETDPEKIVALARQIDALKAAKSTAH